MARGHPGPRLAGSLGAADPERIFPPIARSLHARLFAEWQHRDAARAMIRHIDAEWPSLRSDQHYLAARKLLEDG